MRRLRLIGVGLAASCHVSTDSDTSAPHSDSLETDDTEPGDSDSDDTDLAACTLLLGSATAESIRPLLGVNSGPAPHFEGAADLSDAYDDIGVNMVRTHDFSGPLDLAMMYPDETANPFTDASYEFSESDLKFAAIVDGGFDVYFRIGNSAGNPAEIEPTQFAQYADAVVQIIAHYRDGQWDGFSEPITYVEIWNEPDSTAFWPDLSLNDFNEFYIQVAMALRDAFPDLEIGGSGWTQSAEGSSYLDNYLDAIAEAGAPLDFFSFHLYSNDPEEFGSLAVAYRDALDAHGLVDTPLHITEWNTAASEATEEERVELRAGATGAALMTAAWIVLQEHQVDVSTFYRGDDIAVEDPEMYGLFDPDGHRRKDADAFSLWAKLATFETRVEVTEACGLYALAGEDGEGHRAILLANTGDAHVEYGFATSMGIEEVSDAHQGIREFAPGASVMIPPHAVQLVRPE